MIHDEFPTVSLHNVAETEPAEWAGSDDGHRLCRVPSSVRDSLNVAARERLRHPSGCEIRFVPDGDETISVTLSAPSRTVVRPFWGDFQGSDSYEIDSGLTTLKLSVPDRIRTLESDVAAAGAFDPRVCRLQFDLWVPVAIHDVSGTCRPPVEDELPSQRYLAYGTSITEGASASVPHLTYVSRVARRLGVESLNLGVAGAAYCEPAIAEYIASRDDWDAAILSVSVNMANRGFTLEQFWTRATALVNTVASANPTRNIACVTLFPYHADVCEGDDSSRAAAFRETLRTIVEETPHENVSVVDGPDCMAPTGLTADLLHPGDVGMESIATTLSPVVRDLLE